jgi:hypothetical protein
MNNCEKYGPLLVGMLDGELDSREMAELNEHLIRCSRCRTEYEQLRETSGNLDVVRYDIPSDEELRRLWRSPFSRATRIGGLVLILLGYGALTGYALFEFFTGDREMFWTRVPVAAIAIGFGVLFLHVVLERVKIYRKDPCREIER